MKCVETPGEVCVGGWKKKKKGEKKTVAPGRAKRLAIPAPRQPH